MSAAAPNRPRWRRVLRWSLLSLAVLLLVGALLLGWLLRTTGGANFILEQTRSRVPGELRYEGLSGSLWQGLNVAALQWSQDGQRVELDDLALRVRIPALWNRTLLVEQLAAQKLVVRTTPGEDKPPAELSLPDIELPLAIEIVDAQIGAFELQSGDSVTDFGGVNLAANYASGRVDIERFTIGPQQWGVNASGYVEPQNEYPLELEVEWRFGPQELRGSAELAGDLRTLQVQHAFSGPCAVTSSGELTLLGRVLPAGELRHASPRCELGRVAFDDITLSHSGPPDDYRFEVAATLSAPNVPASRLNARGRGDLTGIEVDSLRGEGDAVTLDASGRFQWRDALQVDARGNFQGLNVALLHESLSGRIDGRFDAQGNAADRFSASLSELRGELNGFPLDGEFAVTRTGRVVDIDDAVLRVGDNALSATGRIEGERVASEFTLQAPDISQVLPAASGRLDARGRVNGTLGDPALNVELVGAALTFADYRAATLTVEAVREEGGDVDIKVEAGQLASAAQSLGDVTLAARGPLNSVATDAMWLIDDRRFEVSLDINLAPEGARGRVRSGQLDLAALGVWQLDQAFEFEAGSAGLSMGEHAWRADEGEVRVTRVVANAQTVIVDATLADMPLAPVQPLLPPNVQLQGRVNADVDMVRENDVWRGAVNWSQRDTELLLSAGDERFRVAFPVVVAEAMLEDTRGTVRYEIAADDNSHGSGDITLLQEGGVLSLDGSTDIALANLEWLSAFIPGVSGLEGRFDATLRLGGTTGTPRVSGELGISRGAATLNDLGVRLTDIRLQGRSEGDGIIDIEGAASSEDGTLNLDGQARRVFSAERTVTLGIKGESVRVVDWAEQKIWVSPDLTLGCSNDGATVDGSLHLPRAQISVRELPESAVARSADVQVAGRENENAPALPVRGRVALSLGENVHIDAFGLDTRLRGDLGLVLSPDRAPRFDGRVRLEDGVFAAYGQKLTVERGNLIYAGPPDNPVLDVQATRTIEEPTGSVTAGVRVSGYARSPRVEIYSDPPLPETEALAYLLLGRSSFESSGADGELLSRAALGLGLSRSSPVAVGIASGLGLDEFAVTGNTLEAAELVAGKQLNEDLYVRYSFGVFSEIGTLLLRYRLSDRLSLEAGASDAQTLDLLYTIEK